MPDRPPAIPRPLKRAVLMEAGYRCAVPGCKQVPVEIVHIVPWDEVHRHEFENLIALCPTCHTLYDWGRIDRSALQGYKANLSLMTLRYGEMERRMLDQLALNPEVTTFRLPGGWDIQLMYLIRDGLIAKAAPAGPALTNGMPAAEDYIVTPAGRQFINRWVKAEPVSAEILDETGSA